MDSEKPNKITRYLIYLTIILVIPVGYIVFSVKDKYYAEKESVYEQDLYQIKYELKGSVTKCQMSKVYSGKQLVDLSSNQKFYISRPSINRAYSRKSKILVVERDDHFYKPANSDSVFIIKANGFKLFYFAGADITYNYYDIPDTTIVKQDNTD